MKRLHSLDIARGIAVLGMLVVHVLWLAHPTELVADLPAFDGAFFAIARGLIHGKFTALFALLFGYGMALQVSSIRRRGGLALPFMRTRAALLGGIGVVHIVALFFGDILLLYALAAFVLFTFMDAARWERVTIVGMVYVVALGISLAVSGAISMPATGAIAGSTYPGAFDVSGRFLHYLGLLLSPSALMVFSAVFMGYHLGDLRIHERWGLLDGLNRWLLPVFVFVSAVGISLQLRGDIGGWYVVYHLGSLPIGVFYLSLALRYLVRPMPLLEAYGRMSLSHYIAQSVILLGFFHLAGSIGTFPIPAAVLLIGVVAVAQLIVGFLWFDRVGIGPLEWVVRWALRSRHSLPDAAARRVAPRGI